MKNWLVLIFILCPLSSKGGSLAQCFLGALYPLNPHLISKTNVIQNSRWIKLYSSSGKVNEYIEELKAVLADKNEDSWERRQILFEQIFTELKGVKWAKKFLLKFKYYLLFNIHVTEGFVGQSFSISPTLNISEDKNSLILTVSDHFFPLHSLLENYADEELTAVVEDIMLFTQKMENLANYDPDDYVVFEMIFSILFQELSADFWDRDKQGRHLLVVDGRVIQKRLKEFYKLAWDLEFLEGILSEYTAFFNENDYLLVKRRCVSKAP